MVGQQILDLLIGVRIPGGQPTKSSRADLDRNRISPPHRSKHSRPARWLRRGGRALTRHRLGAARGWHIPGVGPDRCRTASSHSRPFIARVYGVVGSYVTARLAPDRPMGHALVGGLIGLALSTLGAVVTWNKDLGPHWYPLALIVTAMPTAWLGGKLRVMQLSSNRP